MKMNDKNMHGSIFKKLREERGYKLKDVASGVISTRTLIRFESDETSISIAIFEKLLEKCGISYVDYLAFYYDYAFEENTEFVQKMQMHIQSGSTSKIVNECKKELRKNIIGFDRRIDILGVIDSLNWNEDIELFNENKRIIKEKIESTSKLGWDEIYGLLILINSASRDDFSVEYIDRIIEECLVNIPFGNYMSKYLSTAYCDLLLASLAFLSRNGYYPLAEKRCNDALDIFNEQILLINRSNYYITVISILSKLYLRQNKREGAELANKLLKIQNLTNELTNDSFRKALMDQGYKAICEINKTDVDLEF